MKRTMLQRALLAGAMTAALGATGAWAQSPDPHHPPADTAPGAAQPKPPGDTSGAGGPPGMMGMMRGMPMADMMRMMGMMDRGVGGMGMGMGAGMGMIDRIEGRIAFLRAELKITDAQANAWTAFADALRANAKKLGEVRSAMMQQMGAAPPTLSDRLEVQERWLTARLEGTRAIRSAFNNLYAALSDEQKKTAAELLAPHMGMSAMMMGGQMPPGGMRPPGR